jgi:hypothetical protein
MADKGTWVQIHKVVLSPEERAPQVPDDTKKVPLEMWVKGYLVEYGNIGDIVKVKTLTGRIEEGELVQVNPTFKHNYGDFVPEILQIDDIVNDFMYGDES